MVIYEENMETQEFYKEFKEKAKELGVMPLLTEFSDSLSEEIYQLGDRIRDDIYIKSFKDAWSKQQDKLFSIRKYIDVSIEALNDLQQGKERRMCMKVSHLLKSFKSGATEFVVYYEKYDKKYPHLNLIYKGSYTKATYIEKYVKTFWVERSILPWRKTRLIMIVEDRL